MRRFFVGLVLTGAVLGVASPVAAAPPPMPTVGPMSASMSSGDWYTYDDTSPATWGCLVTIDWTVVNPRHGRFLVEYGMEIGGYWESFSPLVLERGVTSVSYTHAIAIRPKDGPVTGVSVTLTRPGHGVVDAKSQPLSAPLVCPRAP